MVTMQSAWKMFAFKNKINFKLLFQKCVSVLNYYPAAFPTIRFIYELTVLLTNETVILRYKTYISSNLQNAEVSTLDNYNLFCYQCLQLQLWMALQRLKMTWSMCICGTNVKYFVLRGKKNAAQRSKYILFY